MRREPRAPHRTSRLAAAALLATAAALATTTTTPRDAAAFCGFYVAGSGDQLVNNATQVALMREGLRTVLTMSNRYQGPPQDFAMVVPVPVVLQQENVRTLPHDVFDHIERFTAPRLVEYWERDPCYVEPPMPPMPVAQAMPGMAAAAAPRAGSAELGVRIEAQFVVGEYQIVILSATQSSGLETWLRQERYNIPRGAADYLAPYIREGWKFFVARVDIERVQRRPDGAARLSPLRFHYDSPEFRLPVRLGLMNAPEGGQDLIVYVIHPTSRFEVANYRNVFIPTNLDVTDDVRANFASFYGQLFDATLTSAGRRAVVTEYAWQTSSCDPCPAPPLEERELVTLGGDVLGTGSYHGGVMSVTRLHTRYDRATLTEDLVFREAPPVTGGREHQIDANGALERTAVRANGDNNFQARYAIRHPWTGPINCPNPRRGVWGPPPDGRARETQSARDLADAPRNRVNLASAVVSPVPELQLAGNPRPLAAAAQAQAPNPANAAQPARSQPAARRGCGGCGVPGETSGSDAGAGALAAALALLAARRRKRR